MKYLPGLSHDTKPLSCSSGNSKDVSQMSSQDCSQVTPIMERSSHFYATVLPNVDGLLEMNFLHGDDHSLNLSDIQSYSPKVTPLSNPLQIMFQGVCNSYSHTRGGHNNNQNGVIGITIKLVIPFGEKLGGVQVEQLGAQQLPRGTPYTALTSFLRQAYTTTYCNRLEIRTV